MSNPHSGNRDIWIRGNRRAFGAVLIPSLLCFAAAIFFITPAVDGIHIAWRIIAAMVAGFSLVVLVSLLYWIFRPLLAYQKGHLLVYLNPPQVIKVPIDLVEVFFAGQSDSFMPTPLPHRGDELSESRNIVIRLAERATEYHERKVKPIFGSWQEGYIVIRGTWTEPINKETFRFLNKSLVAAHRQQKEEQGI